MSSDPAFILFPDTSWIDEYENPAPEMVPFAGQAGVSMLLTRPLDVPDPVYFEANVEIIRELDYPATNKSWPIMSERMRAILLPQAPEHRLFRVSFIDDTVEPDVRFDDQGKPRSGVAVEGFAAVQFLAHIDAMDMERSDYTPDPWFPGESLTVKKLVLRDIPLPPVFRLSAYPMPLFVSAAGRRVLEEAGIKGVEFWNLARIY
jgi:hypothetical protein